jgi:hypothetical protein
VTAAGLADVGARNLQPLVLGGRVEHALQQLAIAGLELRLVLQPAADRADPHRQGVANRLQLAQTQRPRLARDRGDAGVDPQAREGIGNEGSQLRFEPADLPAQLDAGKALIAT